MHDLAWPADECEDCQWKESASKCDSVRLSLLAQEDRRFCGKVSVCCQEEAGAVGNAKPPSFSENGAEACAARTGQVLPPDEADRPRASQDNNADSASDDPSDEPTNPYPNSFYEKRQLKSR
jgi:hypothetical protein